MYSTSLLLSVGDIAIIVLAVVAVIVAGLYFLNKWASKKMGDQQELIEKSKQTVSIYTIDKKHDKAENVTLPKVVVENLPKTSKVMKMYFVKAKVGPQIVTLMCEKNIYNAIPLKKNLKVELAGIYIVSVKGMKSEAELKKIKREKKARENTDKALAKKEKKGKIS